jgi:hypothetical protein
VLLVTVAVAGAACGGTAEEGGSEREYVTANERLLAKLPHFPGAHEVSRSSAPYFAGDGAESPVAGYTTNVVYEVPRRVEQRDVVDFYVERLHRWRSRLEYQPGVDLQTGEPRPGAWVATLTRGRASVGVNTDNLVPPAGRRFELAVDHAGASR